jgi:ribose/xylose/arabinose/galactoside ABC-type transport system permease subunit
MVWFLSILSKQDKVVVVVGLLCSFVNGILKNSIFDPPIIAQFGSAMINVLFNLLMNNLAERCLKLRLLRNLSKKVGSLLPRLGNPPAG